MRRSAVLMWFLGAPALLAAQGFGVYEHSTCAMGRSGVAAASPCPDGSAIFFNPAGLATLPAGTRLSLGGTLIMPSGKFKYDRFYTSPYVADSSIEAPSQRYLVPNFYFTHRVNEKVGIGLGVYAPYGLGTKWPIEGFEGRFLGYRTDLKSIYVQPSVAYQVHPRLTVGIGLAYIRSDVELNQRLDLWSTPTTTPGVTFGMLGIEPGTDFGDAHLEASGTGFAVNFGAIVKVTDRLSIGGHWLTRKTIEFEGDARFDSIATGIILPPFNPITPTSPNPLPLDQFVLFPLFGPGGPLADSKARTEITMPPQGSIGFAYRVRDDWTVMADYQYVVWGWFNSVTLTFDNAAASPITLDEGYQDTHGFRLGVEHRHSEKLTLRGGYLYHTAAAPDRTVTPLLPEGDRNEFTLGVGYRVASKLVADLGYQFIRQNDRRGRVREASLGNTGVYEFTANLLGAGLVYTF